MELLRELRQFNNAVLSNFNALNKINATYRSANPTNNLSNPRGCGINIGGGLKAFSQEGFGALSAFISCICLA